MTSYTDNLNKVLPTVQFYSVPVSENYHRKLNNKTRDIKQPLGIFLFEKTWLIWQPAHTDNANSVLGHSSLTHALTVQYMWFIIHGLSHCWNLKIQCIVQLLLVWGYLGIAFDTQISIHALKPSTQWLDETCNNLSSHLFIKWNKTDSIFEWTCPLIGTVCSISVVFKSKLNWIHLGFWLLVRCNHFFIWKPLSTDYSIRKRIKKWSFQQSTVHSAVSLLYILHDFVQMHFNILRRDSVILVLAMGSLYRTCRQSSHFGEGWNNLFSLKLWL